MFIGYLNIITGNGIVAVIGIRLDAEWFPAAVQESLGRGGVAFGFGGMRRQLPTCSLVDTVTENGTVDFEDLDCSLAVGTGDEEGHLVSCAWTTIGCASSASSASSASASFASFASSASSAFACAFHLRRAQHGRNAGFDAFAPLVVVLSQTQCTFSIPSLLSLSSCHVQQLHGRIIACPSNLDYQ